MLRDALRLVFAQKGENTTAKAWSFNKEKGFVLYWFAAEGTNALPTPLTADEITPIVEAWLHSSQAKETKLEGWDVDASHDGSNGKGWRVYVEKWGRVADSTYAICAITPAFMWYGK